jgi:DNA-binding response OmpR family regulator
LEILIVEDEKNIQEFVCINLKREGYKIVACETGEEAILLLKKTSFAMAILDINLPGIDGYEVLSYIRTHHPKTAVIMLTAKNNDMDKIIGLESGADDYVAKPFNVQELIARIRSVLRRTGLDFLEQETTLFLYQDVKIDTLNHSAYKKGEKLELTPKEFDLLLYFLKNPGVSFQRNQLMDAVWGEQFFGDTKTVDVHIRKLREKIEEDASNPYYIETVWGIGYRWRSF